MGFDRGEWRDGGVCVQLVLLAHGTAFDIFAHKLRETWPPKFGGNELAGLEVTEVSSGLMVVAASEDGTIEGALRGDIDMTLIGQDVIIEPPIREAGPEDSRDILQG